MIRVRWPGLSKAAQIVLISIFSGTLSSTFGRPPNTPQSLPTNLPVVTNLSIPTYPMIAHTANVYGVVKIHVTTSGTRVSAFDSGTGPPLLIRPTEQNLLTWEFKDDQPTSFNVTFDYRLDGPAQCSMSLVPILELPSKVVIFADAFAFCDPAADTPRHHWWQFWK
jgi:hypothetical protein